MEHSYYNLEDNESVKPKESLKQNQDTKNSGDLKDSSSLLKDSPVDTANSEIPEEDIIINYKGVDIERAERQVLKGVDFCLRAGEFCYLVGRVGSGKSSLMKTMYADVPIKNAEKSHVLGYDVKSISRKKIPYLRRGVGIVFQDFQLLQDRSVAANLRFVLEATGWKDKKKIEERLEEVLNEVGMANKSYKMPHELSGGEQQRIVIARALLNKPKLILADEPTGNLDPQTGEQIVSLLHELTKSGHAVLMATHNLQLVQDYPARTVTCEDKVLS